MIDNIAFICYTSGLEYDDRIRKEILSLNKIGICVEVFFITPHNKCASGTTSYGTLFKEFSLLTRSYFRGGAFTFLKSLEFFLRVRKSLNRFDLIWIHDTETFLFPLLVRKKFVWDLHEIPDRFLNNSLLRRLFQILERKCQFLIHANDFRLNHLSEIGLIKDLSKHRTLRNFPDSNFSDSNLFEKKYDEFLLWLENYECVYLQGIDDPERFPEPTLRAILDYGKLKAVIIGNFDPLLKKKLFDDYGERFTNLLFFTGHINQLSTPAYIRKSKFTIIFYSGNTINTFFCEPNRLFQTIALDKPVIVGKNETMKNIVEKYNFGISINSFGENEIEIINAIEVLLANYDKYLADVIQNKHYIDWSSQEFVINEIITSINSRINLNSSIL